MVTTVLTSAVYVPLEQALFIYPIGFIFSFYDMVTNPVSLVSIFNGFWSLPLPLHYYPLKSMICACILFTSLCIHFLLCCFTLIMLFVVSCFL